MILFDCTLKSIPTVDHQILADHKLGIRRSKKQHSIYYMLRFKHPFQAITRLVKLLYFLHSHRYHPTLSHDIIRQHARSKIHSGACHANDAFLYTSCHHCTRRVFQAYRYTTNVYCEQFVVRVQVEVQNKYDVKLTVELNSRFHKGFDLVFIGDVAVDVGGPVGSDGFCKLLAFFILDISDHHSSGAILCEGKHCSLANATGTSGDDGNLILNFFGVCHFRWNELCFGIRCSSVQTTICQMKSVYIAK
ncbi:hypothetical protein SADUNF_Sadunf15G0092200 [Salix dunnii]|uniref:Uncharacterized protein n=1 Tax=Salix dunnii TaxID=1413687 RepID=A0A835MSL6_9ROSI|nr:hypothetical protein SADUNF_Sadunf15G0092200 [Salix dunnii]